ncbi:Transcriptional regulator PadR-like family protein [Marinitoga hydrogenitolerans DSM 16785]|uniref:Transcriptional regulator PadR-like family protein n=1 Tax=Marinitoga hydrogenitolerans (strain DSM 16785 / JCM 12826 / AT1271) TaxID=1122195 RepID=A0A1M4W559_MARH1|nr:PadR family transcriptional regulator [Marinitoga hydrogenitolerans]SHE76290.1 Transcriptional regulator PadR-like family protein [Marinitoga hydrogenitolerans DSM 16785]
MKKNCPRFKGADLLSGYLLLFLKQQPTHGYLLSTKLKNLGFEITDPAIIYRHLKKMENFGLIYSKIHPGKDGPPKKVFYITDDGKNYLKEIIRNIENRIIVLKQFLNEYERSENNEDSNSVN